MSDTTADIAGTNASEPSIMDFLNPNSMLTPGFAGALTMMITNVLCQFFAMPLALTGLAVSAMFGTLVVVSTGSLLRKGVYYILNSLIIFCVAMGSANIAHDIESQAAAKRLTLSLTGSAYAQTASVNGEMSEQYIKELETITSDPNLTPDQKVKQIADLNAVWNPGQFGNPDPKQEDGGFFKPWSITGK